MVDDIDNFFTKADTSAGEGADRLAEPVDLEQPPRLPFAVVGIGASAGGLEAFTDLFTAMPSDSGMAFVLIQHLPPDRESMMVELLQRRTAMPVQQVDEEMAVAPNHVYLIRPGHTLTIKEGRLHLGERLEKPRHSRPVDDFLKSLAEEQRESAICVIMSGMGSNGAAGAQAIKAVGGLCIAQDPDSAAFPSMPRHLIDAGYADLILRPAEIPDALLAYTRHPYASNRRAAADTTEAGGVETLSVLDREQQQVREILAIVRSRTRFDFSGYKKPTVLRRIQRRMGLNRVLELGKYTKLLRQSATEVTSLADDLLIHVTGFFRDAEAWEALRHQVIAPLVRSRDPDATIRCWVAACSSGEEAYSLAMLLVEESERLGKSLNIKVFATDTAERTLSNARNGLYPGGIESDLSPERLQRFFVKEDAVYRVRQNLRERVVFAPQNVLNDPPFSRLDIVTCRNLLIYLEPEVQQRVFALVHFGLRDGGVLFLGTSETVSASGGMFEAIDKKARIYRRVGPGRQSGVDFPPPPAGGGAALEAPRTSSGAAPSLGDLTSRALVAQHIHAAATVDRNYRVVYYQGDTKLYLSQPAGEPTQDLFALANEEVRGALRAALQRSMSTNSVERVSDAYVTNAEGERQRVVVTASPLTFGGSPDLFVVSFQQREGPDPASVAIAVDGEPAEANPSAHALQRLRNELQRAVEELQASNEEHRAAAEEAMSVNEELQSTNEELETSKEEMQSLNEELLTVNSQLHVKMDELQRTSDDLRSLLANTDIAVIFLDSQLRIRRYTPAARRLLELIGSDVGRPLSDLAKKFVDPDLIDDARAVLEKLVPIEREVGANDERWYARRILPYRAGEDRIEGVVITFVDVSERKAARDLAASRGDAIAADLSAMQKLHAAGVALAAAQDVHAVLTATLCAAVELEGADGGDVQLYDSSTQALQLVVHRGLPAEFVEGWLRAEASDPTTPAARALHDRAPVLVASLELDVAPSVWREKWLGSGVSGVRCVPLLSRGGQPLGVITTHFRRATQLDERSAHILELLARLASDTIERVQLDEERTRLLRTEQQARSALDDTARMKDEFLTTLSHELRTPVAAILLWAKLLRKSASGSEELRKGLDAILSSAEAQQRLIDDLLDTAGISVGKLRLEPSETDLLQVVRVAIEQSAPEAAAKGVRVDADLRSDVGTVRADATRLRQVVWNLLINAVKFTPTGGSIAISLARIDEVVCITVSDTGIGIPAEFLPRVFDRFRQQEGGLSRKHGGLGLGLAISKELVEMHGGTLRAESAGIGRGATFTVSLPLPAVTVSQGSAPGAAADPNDSGMALIGRTVLLVEDDPGLRSALALILRNAGARVATADCGSEAVAQYRDFLPRVVLTRVDLPDFDGYTLLRRIRKLEQEQLRPAAPAVALTAFAADQEQSQKLADAGFDAHLTKPIDAHEVVAVVAGVLSELED